MASCPFECRVVPYVLSSAGHHSLSFRAQGIILCPFERRVSFFVISSAGHHSLSFRAQRSVVEKSGLFLKSTYQFSSGLCLLVIALSTRSRIPPLRPGLRRDYGRNDSVASCPFKRRVVPYVISSAAKRSREIRLILEICVPVFIGALPVSHSLFHSEPDSSIPSRLTP